MREFYLCEWEVVVRGWKGDLIWDGRHVLCDRSVLDGLVYETGLSIGIMDTVSRGLYINIMRFEQ